MQFNCGTIIKMGARRIEHVGKNWGSTVSMETVLSTIQRHLRHWDILKCVMAKWDKKSGQIVNREGKERILAIAWMILHLFHVICQAYSILIKSKGLINTSEAFGIFGIYVTAFCLRFDLDSDPVPLHLLNYVRSMKGVEYDRSVLQFLVVLFYCIEFCYLAVPTLMATLTILLPCKPPLLSSVICNYNWKPGWIVRSLFSAVEYLQGYQMGVASTHYSTIITLPTFCYLWVECKRMQAEMKASFRKRVHDYRKLQVYEKILNSCIRGRIFPSITLLIPAVKIGTYFGAIKMLPQSGSRSFMFLYFCGVMYCFTLSVFTAAAKINTLTTDGVRRAKVVENIAWGRRVKNSLMPLRLQFGNNFVEASTPLVVQEFCVRTIASLLLMTR